MKNLSSGKWVLISTMVVSICSYFLYDAFVHQLSYWVLPVYLLVGLATNSGDTLLDSIMFSVGFVVILLLPAYLLISDERNGPFLLMMASMFIPSKLTAGLVKEMTR